MLFFFPFSLHRNETVSFSLFFFFIGFEKYENVVDDSASTGVRNRELIARNSRNVVHVTSYAELSIRGRKSLRQSGIFFFERCVSLTWRSSFIWVRVGGGGRFVLSVYCESVMSWASVKVLCKKGGRIAGNCSTCFSV